MINETVIRHVAEKDAATITRIYNHYITDTTTSFEMKALSEDEMLGRIKDISPHYPYFVAEQKGRVVGYCYVHQWKDRAAYCNTLEVTIYLDPEHKGCGTGSLLMKHLIEACRKLDGCKNLIACITEENAESIAFHKRMGFEKVSHFKKVGYKLGRWLDVVDMEMML